MKPKYGEKAKLCYMDTDSLIFYIKTEDIYINIGKNVETRFDTLNHDLEIPLTKVKNNKVIGLLKDKLGGQIIEEFAALRPKTYSYLTNDTDENKKAKGLKSVIKQKLKFEDYNTCLETNQREKQINHLKNKLDTDSFREKPKEFIRNTKLKV